MRCAWHSARAAQQAEEEGEAERARAAADQAQKSKANSHPFIYITTLFYNPVTHSVVGTFVTTSTCAAAAITAARKTLSVSRHPRYCHVLHFQRLRTLIVYQCVNAMWPQTHAVRWLSKLDRQQLAENLPHYQSSTNSADRKSASDPRQCPIPHLWTPSTVK